MLDCVVPRLFRVVQFAVDVISLFDARGRSVLFDAIRGVTGVDGIGVIKRRRKAALELARRGVNIGGLRALFQAARRRERVSIPATVGRNASSGVTLVADLAGMIPLISVMPIPKTVA